MTETEIPQARRHARVTGERREALSREMARLYGEGSMSIREVAERFGRSYGATHAMLRESGVVLRPQGGRAK